MRSGRICGVLSVCAVALAVFAPAASASGDAGSVAAALDHTCAVRTSGHIDCWGQNYYDIFGESPGDVAGPNASADTFTKVAVSPYLTCGLTVGGRVECWGMDAYARWYTVSAVNANTGSYTDLAVSNGGLGTVCALTPGGHPVCLGYSPPSGSPPAEPLSQISVGDAYAGAYFAGNYACGVTTAGHLACWGFDEGFLAHVNASTGTFTQVSAGPYEHVCGLTAAGRIECWGPDSYGSDSGPTASTSTFSQVSAGFEETCGVRGDGRLRCWGPGEASVTGPNASTDTFSEVSVGWNDVCALKTDGHVVCWGRDSYDSINGPNASTHLYGYQSDSTPPTVSVPDPITAEATGPDGAAVDFAATASDPDDTAGPVTCDPRSGSTFPLGTTAVTCSSTDTHGNTGSASFDVTVVDTTPPALSGTPADVAVDATGPDGAAVTYASPTATDLVDGSVAVDCSPPSGSTFAIGDTTVTCTATDAHGNAASAAFSVHVRGAGEQLADLLAYVTGIGPGKSLAAKVLVARRALARGDAATAVSDLDALDAETAAQDGKKLTSAQAAAIEAAVARIDAVLGF